MSPFKERHTGRRHRFDPWVRKDPLEKEMATHSSILAWEIPRTEEPGRLQSMGSQRDRHHGKNLALQHVPALLLLGRSFLHILICPQQKGVWFKAPGRPSI